MIFDRAEREKMYTKCGYSSTEVQKKIEEDWKVYQRSNPEDKLELTLQVTPEIIAALNEGKAFSIKIEKNNLPTNVSSAVIATSSDTNLSKDNVSRRYYNGKIILHVLSINKAMSNVELQKSILNSSSSFVINGKTLIFDKGHRKTIGDEIGDRLNNLYKDGKINKVGSGKACRWSTKIIS